MSFGDSVVFCYDFATHRLRHSFGQIGEFDNPPFLINCKDEVNKRGFRSGEWKADMSCLLFAASDALAHYILMMYEVCHKESFAPELSEAESHHSKNENFIKVATTLPNFDFEKDILGELLSSMKNPQIFGQHLQVLVHRSLMAVDDYSLAVLGMPCSKSRKERMLKKIAQLSSRKKTGDYKNKVLSLHKKGKQRWVRTKINR